MDPDFTIIVRATASGNAPTSEPTAVSSPSGDGLIQFHHGTDENTAQWIAQHGVSYEQMALYIAKYSCGLKIKPDYFWTSIRLRTACDYANINNAVNMNGAIPAVLSFSLPVKCRGGVVGSRSPVG